MNSRRTPLHVRDRDACPLCPLPLLALLLCASVSATGCASGPASRVDPLEPWNRTAFEFNEGLDRAVLRPAATAYTAAVPAPVRTGVRNVFANLDDVWSAVNSMLQLKVGDAAQNVMRVVLNTTVGLGGVLDVATSLGVERHPESFGGTLARWSVPPGPYLVLPFFGPSELRGSLALPLDFWGAPVRQVSPVADRNVLLGTEALAKRADAIPATKLLEEASLDKYLFVRDAYLQRRDHKAHTLDAVRSTPLEERWDTAPAESDLPGRP
jgi:phospholipid-binding lipoprotein MlaA